MLFDYDSTCNVVEVLIYSHRENWWAQDKFWPRGEHPSDSKLDKAHVEISRQVGEIKD